MRRARAVAALVLVSAGAGCADLSPLEAGVCGNFVVDHGENCDGHAIEGGRCAAPGEANACRYVCSDAPCPTGFGCGHDHVCRRPSGAFVALGAALPIVARSLRTADFDGDGAPEILILGEEDALGRRPARIVYPEVNAFEPLIVPLPLDVAASSIGDIERGDGRADLVLAELDGISILRGRADRRIDFAAFPRAEPPAVARLRTTPLDALPASPGDELTLLVDGEGISSLFVGTAPEAGPTVLASLSQGIDELAGDPVAGRFDEGSYCPLVAFPFASSVLLFSPCRAEGPEWAWNVSGLFAEVKLPQGISLDAPAHVVDLDGDGHLDLLLAGGGAAFAAYGRGDGTFGSAPSAGLSGQAGAYPLPDVNGAPIASPLVVRDLDGDGALDYVIPEGVLASGGGPYAFSFLNIGGSWTHASVGDFNGDGLPDVAAGARDAINIDLLLNAGGGLYNHVIVATDGPTAHFAVGDFDGDLVDDLAFSEELLEGGHESDAPAVMFGNFHGLPSTFARFATLGEVEQIITAQLADVTGPNGLSDIAVIARRQPGETDKVFVLNGSTSRSLRAPLPARDGQRAFLPLASSVGTFVPDGKMTACVVGQDDATGALHLLHVLSSDKVVYGALSPSAPLSPLFQAGSANLDFHRRILAASGDLNGDRADEVVVAGPYGASPDGAALVVASLPSPGGPFLPLSEQTFSADITLDSTLTIADADGDGAPDVLITTGDEEAPLDLIVIWNDGSGGLLTDAPLTIALDGGTSAVARLPRSDGGYDLLVTSIGGTHLLRFAPDRSFVATPIADLPAGYGVATGDFDRDGVTDVAMLTTFGLHLFRGQPELL